MRNELYEEEVVEKEGLSQQVSVLVKHTYYRNFTHYDTSFENGVLMARDILYKNKPIHMIDRIIFYVSCSDKALALAHRWCTEKSDDKDKYEVIGVDTYFSIFD